MPWLLLLKANAKAIAVIAVMLGALAAGYQLKARFCALEVAEIRQSIADVVTAEEERQRQEAVKLQDQIMEIEALRKKLNRRVLDAKDSSFGCIVDGDGMQLLADAISGDSAAVNARAVQ